MWALDGRAGVFYCTNGWRVYENWRTGFEAIYCGRLGDVSVLPEASSKYWRTWRTQGWDMRTTEGWGWGVRLRGRGRSSKTEQHVQKGHLALL